MNANRYFHISTVAIDGSVSSWQIFTNDISKPLMSVRERARRGADPLNSWDKPLILAFAFDTQTRERMNMVVDSDGDARVVDAVTVSETVR
ncbi:MAG TPA: hypothetical protein VM531_08975 [Sphingomicrobium sp.]|jgi:hypothetical protein|nr:hypothetical protein [Sphingomicrobium sp.]